MSDDIKLPDDGKPVSIFEWQKFFIHHTADTMGIDKSFLGTALCKTALGALTKELLDNQCAEMTKSPSWPTQSKADFIALYQNNVCFSEAQLHLPHTTRTEPIIGWRVWRITDLHLVSWTRPSVVWLPGAPMHADSFSPTSHYTRGFSNGIHAFTTLYDLESSFRRRLNAMQKYRLSHGIGISNDIRGILFMRHNRKKQNNDIYGEVALWGEVVEHTLGYRAEYAYPHKLYAHESIASALKNLYGCEVESYA